MAEGKLISVNQLKIDKANQTIVVVVGICAFLVVFSLVASKSLLSQYSYQNRVTAAQQATVTQLQADKTATTSLVNSYNTFTNQSVNIIGGSATGSGSQDGTNGKIILDALPDTYDFPALVTSVQNLLSIPGASIQSIGGTDNGNNSSTSTTSSTTNSSVNSVAPIAIPFNFSVQGSYADIQTILNNIQHSIRPIQVQSIDMSGSDNLLTLTVTAQTYYLPAAGLNISTETVK